MCPLNENNFLLPLPFRSLVNQALMAKIQAGQCITDGRLLNAIIMVQVGGVSAEYQRSPYLCRHRVIYLACVGIKSVCQSLSDHFSVTLSMHLQITLGAVKAVLNATKESNCVIHYMVKSLRTPDRPISMLLFLKL